MDPALLPQDDITTTRNTKSWATENQHEVAECNFQHRFSVNMWCGILDNNKNRPHVIEGCLAVLYNGILWKMNYCSI
jgi:hypothetical protein